MALQPENQTSQNEHVTPIESSNADRKNVIIYECPLDCDWKDSERVREHLVAKHKVSQVDCPFKTPLDWRVETTSVPSEEGRWNILLKFPGGQSFLLSAEEDIEDDNSKTLGDFHFQIQHLESEGKEKFIGTLKYECPNKIRNGAWEWITPTFCDPPKHVFFKHAQTQRISKQLQKSRPRQWQRQWQRQREKGKNQKANKGKGKERRGRR